MSRTKQEIVVSVLVGCFCGRLEGADDSLTRSDGIALSALASISSKRRGPQGSKRENWSRQQTAPM